MPQLRVTLCLAVSLLLAGCAEPDPVSLPDDAGQTLSLTGANVLRNPVAHPELSRTLVRGTRVNTDGCKMLHEVELPPGERLLERIVEYDPTSCEFIVARHDPDLIRRLRPDLDEREATTTSARSPAQASAAASASGQQYAEHYLENPAAGGGPSPGPTTTSSQCTLFGDVSLTRQRIWSQDPPGIVIAESDQIVDWGYVNNVCVSWTRRRWWSKWYTLSGWYQTAFSPFYTIYTNYSGVQWVGQSGYWNNTFCPDWIGGTGLAFTNELRVFDDGWRVALWGYQEAGGCTQLIWGSRYVV